MIKIMILHQMKDMKIMLLKNKKKKLKLMELNIKKMI